MKKLFIILIVVFNFWGCQKTDYSKEAPKMHWDRDMCQRCKMAISERFYGVMAVDKDNKVYKFDDIGCLFLWQKQEHPEIEIKKVWITDAKTGKWIDAKKAFYTKGNKTPMDYGFAAYEKKQKDKTNYSFIDVREEIFLIGR